ncbi:hypothetical protein [Sphingomonas sp. PAMC 26605]|nr:hypothetical protein [Sphingomonas sp. PAMC 26605]
MSASLEPYKKALPTEFFQIPRRDRYIPSRAALRVGSIRVAF